VIVGVMLGRFAGVVRGVKSVPVRNMAVMAGLFVIALLMIFRCFAVMIGRVPVVFGSLPVVFSALVVFHHTTSFRKICGCSCVQVS
jgi:hypothetical protein